MKTITLRNIKSKASFTKIAELAADIAQNKRVLVRFTMGGKLARTFTASPKKPLATLIWEWATSPAGLAAKKSTRKTKPVVSPDTAVPTLLQP